jgi:hypothetical protein
MSLCVCMKERERERERYKVLLESYEFHQNMSTKSFFRSISHLLTICLNHVNVSC